MDKSKTQDNDSVVGSGSRKLQQRHTGSSAAVGEVKGSEADYDKSAQGQSQRNRSSFILKRKTKPQACEKIKLEHLSLSKKARTDQEGKGA